MGKNTSIALSDHHLKFLNRQVESGRYASISEAMRDAVRFAEQREAKITALNRALQEGLDSGPAQDFDWDEFMERKFGEQKTGNDT